jgi:hypothetical protein
MGNLECYKMQNSVFSTGDLVLFSQIKKSKTECTCN